MRANKGVDPFMADRKTAGIVVGQTRHLACCFRVRGGIDIQDR